MGMVAMGTGLDFLLPMAETNCPLPLPNWCRAPYSRAVGIFAVVPNSPHHHIVANGVE
jgi:hypothetical protein